MKHFLVLSLVMFLFQNCGESVDLSVYSKTVPEPTDTGENPPPPPLPPPPTGVPVPTTASLVSQSPASITIRAGESTSLYIAANVSPIGTAVFYEWYFNGSLLNSGATLSMINLSPAAVSNSGLYKVVIKEASTLNVLLESHEFRLTVNPESILYDPATLTHAGMEFLATIGAGTTLQQTATAFCHTKHGANATVVSAVTRRTRYSTNRFVMLDNDCRVNTRIFNLGNGLCAFDSGLTFNFDGVLAITCRP